MAEDQALLEDFARKDAECQRRRTQKLVNEMADASTPESLIAAAKARARAVHAQIDELAAQGDLKAVQQAPVEPVDLRRVRIDDLETLFNHREELPAWLQNRLKTIYAKINWQTRKGKRGFFNKAVHMDHIPIDKALTILAHLKGVVDDDGPSLDPLIDSIIECGLFPKIKKGKIKKGGFQYGRRCQDGEHCELCNYLNVSDGVKTLLAAYDESAFFGGGNWFGLTVAARTDPAQARAVGRTVTPEDWHRENPESVVYRESHCSRVFAYPELDESDYLDDYQVEERIRAFLGAVQSVFGKLVKNGWLDGIRAKVENSIEFLPFASHQHWHAVGSSRCEHDPQKMAEFVQEEVNAILTQTCRCLYADVMVAVLPTPEDLEQWIKYINKTVKLVEAVASVYNRHPGLCRDDPIFEQLAGELRCFLERSRRVFRMKRFGFKRKRGSVTYMLNRRFVRGSHKFGKGSILSESERHRAWRKLHAKTAAKARRSAKEGTKVEADERESYGYGPTGGRAPRKTASAAPGGSRGGQKRHAVRRRRRPRKKEPGSPTGRLEEDVACPPGPASDPGVRDPENGGVVSPNDELVPPGDLDHDPDSIVNKKEDVFEPAHSALLPIKRHRHFPF